MKFGNLFVFFIIVFAFSIPLVFMFANYGFGVERVDVIDVDSSYSVSGVESGGKIVFYVVVEVVLLLIVSSVFFDWRSFFDSRKKG